MEDMSDPLNDKWNDKYREDLKEISRNFKPAHILWHKPKTQASLNMMIGLEGVVMKSEGFTKLTILKSRHRDGVGRMEFEYHVDPS